MNLNLYLERIESLPSFPKAAMIISEKLQDPKTTIPEVSELIRLDPAISARVLKLANSSYYSVPGGAKDISKALQYLGFNTLSQIVLTGSLLSVFQSKGSSRFSMDSFWRHSFAVALLSEGLGKELQKKQDPTLFLSGLMHDLGKLLQWEAHPEGVHQIIEQMDSHKISWSEAENNLKIPSHTDIGKALGEYWNLPIEIQNALSGHHTDQLSLVFIANRVAHELGITIPTQFARNNFESLSLTKASLDRVLNRFQIDFEKAGALLYGH